MDELYDWFSRESNNIGIVTGKISGIVVVDLDSEAAQEFAKNNRFPDTPSVKTPKGYHLYYKYPDNFEVRNFQKRDDLPNIDLRGDGGYVVAPPSVHPSGNVYEWVDGKSLNNLPLSEDFPSIILNIKKEKTSIKELLQGVPEGRRNDSLFKIALSLKKEGLNVNECLRLAQAVNERNNPPLPDEELKRTVKGIFDRYENEKPVSQFPTLIYAKN